MIQRSPLSRLALGIFLGATLLLPLSLQAAKKTEKSAQSGPRTVIDYFLLVPDTWVSIPVEERKALLIASGTINDVKNGFIAFTQNESDSYAFTVFKKPDGSYLSAFCFKGQALSKTGAMKDTCQIMFLDFDQGTWTDVTSKVLPTSSRTDLFYELPRIGTTIKVKAPGSSEEFELLWKDGAFKKK